MTTNGVFLNYLNSAKKQFEYYKNLGDKTIDQIPEEKLFWQFNQESNSIAIIIKHLNGNMLSRWTDFMTTDGEKEWRNRDVEFDNDIKSKTNLLRIWNDGWQCLFNALDSLSEEDLLKTIYIRNEAYTVQEAINRQLAHYPYHIGQIVFIGKMICNEKWQSLSIPKNKSNAYNIDKMSKKTKLKGVLINDITLSHESFWNTALSFSLDMANKSINGKWSVAQNAEHINKVLAPFAKYMTISKLKLEELFGIAQTESRDENKFVEDYGQVIKGAKAPPNVTPEEKTDYKISELVENGRVYLKNIIASLNNWSEEELDKYLCPHPLLGKLTVREMFYFMTHHVNHHHKSVQSILVNSPV